MGTRNYLLARIFTLGMALFLQIIPQPNYLQYVWPQWLLVVILLWYMYNVSSFSLLSVWCLGLLVDLLSNSPFGLHAFCYVFVAYCVKRWIRQLGHFKNHQKALWLLVIVFLAETIKMLGLVIFSLSISIFCYAQVVTTVLIWLWFVNIFDVGWQFRRT